MSRDIDRQARGWAGGRCGWFQVGASLVLAAGFAVPAYDSAAAAFNHKSSKKALVVSASSKIPLPPSRPRSLPLSDFSAVLFDHTEDTDFKPGDDQTKPPETETTVASINVSPESVPVPPTSVPVPPIRPSSLPRSAPSSEPQSPPPPRLSSTKGEVLLGVDLDPRWPKRLFVISDSVMLGAKPALIKNLPDWRVNFVGRPALMVNKAMDEVRQQSSPIGSVAVVALGYNSLWQKDRQNFAMWSERFDKNADEMLALLKAKGARKVVWVLLRELSPQVLPSNGTATMQYNKYSWYFPYVNERLRAIKARHPELALADWTSASRQPGLTYDAIHVNPKGAELMVRVVKVAMGVDGLPSGAFAPTEDEANDSDQQTAAMPASITQVSIVPKKPISDSAPAPDNTQAPTSTPAPTPIKDSYAFRDCANCPEMVVLPAGSFTMGSPASETDRGDNEGPQRLVTIARPFAVGKFEVTFAEWQACVAGGGCKTNPKPSDEGWGEGRQPVVNVSWDDAVEYAKWLSRTTGKSYRLLIEAEWEYAARAGTSSPYATGATIAANQANFKGDDDVAGCDGQQPIVVSGKQPEIAACDEQNRERAVHVGSFPANAWGLNDMHGNVWEWVEDNWHEDYSGAPADGSAAPGGDKSLRVLRGGSWYSVAASVRSASRHRDQPDYHSGEIGFRLARGL